MIGVVGAAAEQVLEQVVAHAVEHQVDGEGTALVHLLREVAIPGLAVAGKLLLGLALQLGHILGIELLEQQPHLLQHPIQSPGRGQRIALVTLVAQYPLGAPAIGGPAEAEHLDPILGFEAGRPLQHILQIVVEAMDEQQQVLAGLELLFARPCAGAALQQLARHIGAGRVAGGGIQPHALGHLGGDLVGQQVQLPFVSLAAGLRQSQLIRACLRPVAEDAKGALAPLVHHTVGHYKHSALLLSCPRQVVSDSFEILTDGEEPSRDPATLPWGRNDKGHPKMALVDSGGHGAP
ncbi:hypothetical protein D3C86_1494210 [compost metagenome]